MPQADLANERHAWDIRGLVEIMSIERSEFVGQLLRRKREPAGDFNVRGGERNFFRQRFENARAYAHDSRRDLAHACHDILRERIRKVGILAPRDQHEVRRMDPDPSPQRVRFRVLSIGNAGGRKHQSAPVRIGERNRQEIERPGIHLARVEFADLLRDQLNGLVCPAQSANQKHGGRIGGRAGH